MADVSFSTFPAGKVSALTMLYLEHQDLSKLTPEMLLEKYDEVYFKIREHYEAKRKQNKNYSFD